MAEKTVAEKMRIKPGMKIALLHAPDGWAAVLGVAEGTTLLTDPAGADVLLLFVSTQAELEERFPAVLSSLSAATQFWIIYPKGSKAAGHDVSRDTIWPMAESLGFRPVGMVSVDETWSGFRLKPGT